MYYTSAMEPFAVIETGGKQYLVSAGQKLKIEKLVKPAKGPVVFDKVLLLSDGKKTQIGTPYLSGAKVEAEYVSEGKGDKVWVFKYKSKVRYRVNRGHRQPFTEVKIGTVK